MDTTQCINHLCAFFPLNVYEFSSTSHFHLLFLPLLFLLLFLLCFHFTASTAPVLHLNLLLLCHLPPLLFLLLHPHPCSGDPAGQRQPDTGHQPVQAAGEGRDRQRQQCAAGRSEANRCVRRRRHNDEVCLINWCHSDCVFVRMCLAGGGTALLDLSGLDTSPPSFPEIPTPTDSLTTTSQEMGLSLLDDELMSLGDRN